MFISAIKFGGTILSKRQLVIYDKDEKYAGNLMEYLGGKKDFPYKISAFSKKEALMDYSKDVQIHLLLASESAYKEIQEHVKAERVMILNESGTLTWNDLQNIKKYQSAENIVQEIMHYYVEIAEVMPAKMTTSKDVIIIGFFSPIGRCSQTTMGLTLGQIMSERCETLYMNFESLSGFPYMLGYEEGKDISDLLYFLEMIPEKFDLNLQRCVRQLDNLHYILPMKAMHQLLLIKSEMWQKLISTIANSGIYKVIILDLSEGMQGLFDILRMCTHIYTLTKDDKFADAKIQQYEQLLQICRYEDIIDKTHKRKVPIMKEIPSGFCYHPGSEYSGYIKNMLKEDGIYV